MSTTNISRDALRTLAVQRGAIGFDYHQNAAGEIDIYRFRYAWENVVPQFILQPGPTPEPDADVHYTETHAEESDTPETIPAPASDVLPFAAVPKAMCDVTRWCVWQKHKDGRKIPYRVLKGGVWSKAERCKSDASSLWVSFEAALHCYLKSNGHLGGLSFALGDGWSGFDFDDCIVGGKTHRQVDSWLKRLGGYQEISQSGKGVKTILYGTLSESFLGSAQTGRQFKNIPVPGMATEVYYCRRFFFLTGEGTGEPKENQAVIDEICDELVARKSLMNPQKPVMTSPKTVITPPATLSDDAVLEKVRHSRQAVKFDALWNGRIGTYQSASEADMALTSILMFWCGNDSAQAERIFRQSALAKREKWDREDYRERTLNKAIRSEVYQPRLSTRQTEVLKKRGVIQ